MHNHAIPLSKRMFVNNLLCADAASPPKLQLVRRNDGRRNTIAMAVSSFRAEKSLTKYDTVSYWRVPVP